MIKNVVVEELVKQGNLPEEAIEDLTPMSSSINPLGMMDNGADSDSTFKVQGTISTSPESTKYPITILRDTGSAQSILSKTALPLVETKYTGRMSYLHTLDSKSAVPLAEVVLDSDLLKGIVKVAVVNTDLPIPGVTFLLGNDLAGNWLIPELEVTDKPLLKSPTESLDIECPHVFPAVTRSQSNNSEPDLLTSSSQESLFSQVMSKENLILAQEADPSLAKF
ncbi:hypothetical protein Pmani_004536 [Petrolisthes manimaculis]|uniref:Uncharacterized protein n=1 Tax=Petrolisthes manimaculis TaxID=1843537 RepID=A0AAE1QDZ2_9EUCA|nr:hypothetical protein Pmani_004536 [Petrolisthes manimaculis]